MLSWRQRKAIKLMFRKPDDEVAAEVGVRPEVIAQWRRKPEFREALAAEQRAVRAAAARMASAASLDAAKHLHKLLAEAKDGKLSLDILKAVGAFEEGGDGAEETLEDIIRRVAEEDEVET